MKTFVLLRISGIPDGMFGVLKDEKDVPFAVTAENRWYGNQRNISCIPGGAYVCERVKSPKFGNTFQVNNVPNRTHILFHRGNTHHDTKGCILVGEEFGRLRGVTAVLHSGKGYREFMSKLSGEDSFNLVITIA